MNIEDTPQKNERQQTGITQADLIALEREVGQIIVDTKLRAIAAERQVNELLGKIQQLEEQLKEKKT